MQILLPKQIIFSSFFFEQVEFPEDRLNTIEEHLATRFNPEQVTLRTVMVSECWQLTESEYDWFSKNLLLEQAFLKGKGGANSLNAGITPDKEQLLDWSQEDWDLWHQGAYDIVVAIIAPNRNAFVVNPRGLHEIGLIPLGEASVFESRIFDSHNDLQGMLQRIDRATKVIRKASNSAALTKAFLKATTLTCAASSYHEIRAIVAEKDELINQARIEQLTAIELALEENRRKQAEQLKQERLSERRLLIGNGWY